MPSQAPCPPNIVEIASRPSAAPYSQDGYRTRVARKPDHARTSAAGACYALQWMWRLVAVAAVGAIMALVACGDDSGDADQPAPTTASAPVDAGAPDATVVAESEPPGGFHLDSIDDERTTNKSTARRGKRVNPVIQITLRSSPPGAMAAIDGKLIGHTPAFWEGEATGKAMDFTFVLHGYAMARYRFVPVTDGVVHGQLTKLVAPTADAGP
jgi:hypothetical protein